MKSTVDKNRLSTSKSVKMKRHVSEKGYKSQRCGHVNAKPHIWTKIHVCKRLWTTYTERINLSWEGNDKNIKMITTASCHNWKMYVSYLLCSCRPKYFQNLSQAQKKFTASEKSHSCKYFKCFFTSVESLYDYFLFEGILIINLCCLMSRPKLVKFISYLYYTAVYPFNPCIYV